MKEENFISVISYIDDLNTEINDILKKITLFLEENFKYYEIIIAVDNSSSKKKEELSEIIRKEKLSATVSVIYLENKFGEDKSLSAAIDLSIGDYIVEAKNIERLRDTDTIFSLYKECLNGNDACILVPEKTSLFEKIYYRVIKKHCYMKYDNYRENGIITVVSRRMINRMGALKKQITNKWLFYKMSGLPCKYIKKDTKRNKHSIQNLNNAINTILIFTNLPISILTGIEVVLSVLLIVNIVLSKWRISFSLFSLIVLNMSLLIIIKKQALSLEYLWTDSSYQFGSIEKFGKE